MCFLINGNSMTLLAMYNLVVDLICLIAYHKAGVPSIDHDMSTHAMILNLMYILATLEEYHIHHLVSVAVKVVVVAWLTGRSILAIEVDGIGKNYSNQSW